MIGTDYDRAEALVLMDEGSTFTQNPKDPGGPTKLGVTQAALSNFLGRPASVDDVKALTPDSVKPIYKAKYWTAVRGDELPAGVDYFCFDSAVQHGRSEAVKILQEALGANPDGAFGDMTMAALRRVGDTTVLIEQMRQIRLAYYKACPAYPTFGHGWLARLTRVASTSAFWARKAA